MIKHYVTVSLKDTLKGSINKIQTQNSIVLQYPCLSKHDCTPYVLSLSKGLYRFECWGSSACFWAGRASKPGLGGYTAGTLYIPQPTLFYVYIGTIDFFNAVENMKTDVNAVYPGGATDVRLNYSENWWENSSLISRIMVSAGGGSAEWTGSRGGNGGQLEGDESLAAKNVSGQEFFKDPCKGATQISGSDCVPLFSQDINWIAVKGEFGKAGRPKDSHGDFGAFGGGGYYGGTSYMYSFAGSGGSSFISGHENCNAVKEQANEIEHTGDRFHYSGFVFSNTEMISGNKTMPLPNSLKERNIYSGEGAFRITLVQHCFFCSCRKTLLFSSFAPFFITIFYFS